MEGDGGEAVESSRWTCEACGCHTNEQSDRTCSICGTGRSGSSLLRRAGRGYSYAAASHAGWLSRNLVGSRRFQEVLDDEEDEFWEGVVDGVDMDDPESAIESLAMEVSGIAQAARGRLSETSRQRFLEAARAFSQATAEVNPRVVPSEVLRTATLNAAQYQPLWANPSTLVSGRGQGTNGMILVDVGNQSLAHVPPGAGEGRAIRAVAPMPAGEASSSFINMPSPLNVEPRRGRAFGFRVAFDHPTCQQGGNMGGCHMVGVTTSSFTSFGDHNGLQSTPFFWGIEDSGKKYEGSRRTGPGTLARRTGGGSAFAAEIPGRETLLSPAGVLFGSREVVTVVCDFDTRSMSFWRNDTSLGALVTSLPRGNGLFPVAVPFNRGVAVAITGLDGDPLPLLTSFAVTWRHAQKEKEDLRRRKLQEERKSLIVNGKLTQQLRTVLCSVFSEYSGSDDSDTLEYTEAARLWYRCGFKLSSLHELLDKTSTSPTLSLEAFLQVIAQIAEDDEKVVLKIDNVQEVDVSCQVGDKVELVEGFEKYGDASGGPLAPGDRGVVVDLQNAPNGERRSVRVFHDGRRWWYQPHAIVSERSGLIETPAVWLLRSLLRSHAFDPFTLVPFTGEQVRVGSSSVGDFVRPKPDRKSSLGASKFVFGRISAETVPSPSTASSRSRDTGSISVDFIDQYFLECVGVKPLAPAGVPLALQNRRVRQSKLVHSSPFEIIQLYEGPSEASEGDPMDSDHVAGRVQESFITDRVRNEIDALGRLDLTSTDFIVKECQKSSESLATLFSCGLPSAVLSAIDSAERLMHSLEPREDLPEKILLLGRMLQVIAHQLFGPKGDNLEVRPEDDSSDEPPPLARRREGDATWRLAGTSAENRRSESELELLQERRTMLLSLMARSRREDATIWNELMERESELGDRPSEPSPLERPVRSSRDISMNWRFQNSLAESAGLNHSAIDVALQGTSNRERSGAVPRSTDRAAYLDGLLRCRGGGVDSVLSMKSGSASNAGFLRQLTKVGLLLDNLSWLKATVEAHEKKFSSLQKSTSMLKDLADEEDVPLLVVALSLGNRTEIITYLIMKGAQVDRKSIEKAATTIQVESLRLLLRHAPYPEDLDVSPFSQPIRDVFEEAKLRQEDLDRKMRQEAGTFMVHVLRRLSKLCLASRRGLATRAEFSSKAMAEILVGNVLLRSLQRTQQMDRLGEDDDGFDSVGRAPVHDDDDIRDLGHPSEGLLAALPFEILREALLSEVDGSTSFLSLVEDYLWSKDMTDAASGLAILATVLTTFPDLKRSSLLQRYGIGELIEAQYSLAGTRVAQILAAAPDSNGDSAVCCPRGHTAVIHITRHSSFRCDICHNGVERGRPMHGCRACDWDACESCTDKTRSGFVKSSEIRELAAKCRLLLDGTGLDAGDSEAVSEFGFHDALQEVSSLSTRLRQGDIGAAKELGALLLKPGLITIHEFRSMVLSSLHSVLVHRGRSEQRIIAGVDRPSGRRNKKARVVGELDDHFESFDHRQQFGRQVMRLFIYGEEACPDLSNRAASVGAEHNENMEIDHVENTRRMNEMAMEVLRRIHQVLAFQERLPPASPLLSKTEGNQEAKGGDLQALTKCIELKLRPAVEVQGSARSHDLPLILQCEPLVQWGEIQRHILRASNAFDRSSVDYCKRLADERAIIAEKPTYEDELWRIAKVVSFDGQTGSHSLCYCVEWIDPRLAEGSLDVVGLDSSLFDRLLFEDTEVSLVLAVRAYVVLSRDQEQMGPTCHATMMDWSSCLEGVSPTVGSRVEYRSGGSWTVCTLLHVDSSGSYTVVSDNGELVRDVSPRDVRSSKPSTSGQSGRDAWAREDRGSLTRVFPFFPARQRPDRGRPDEATGSSAILKRTWSALALSDSARPIDLTRTATNVALEDRMILGCRIGTTPLNILFDPSAVETPLLHTVTFSLEETSPGLELSTVETLACGLKKLHDRSQKVVQEHHAELFYVVTSVPQASVVSDCKSVSVTKRANAQCLAVDPLNDQATIVSKSMKLSSLASELLCQGLDDTCIKCMEVISEFARHLGSQDSEASNAALSKKLLAELSEPLAVIAGNLPSWCIVAPSYAPRVFSYEARKTLLERKAFGESRSTLKLQESKVNVGRLRHRMASLRARAVELVGEAFSGGAEDPTALQLQADELYGMEEALAARIRASFRSLKWQEHVLQVAKGVVRRDYLLGDAAEVMDQYANETKVSRRRLEVRFQGESGFDAASGSEAGVTRGFYADVAECLVSSEFVAGIYCSSTCSPSLRSLASLAVKSNHDDLTGAQKLPLWIPDMDSTGQVVLPTPRADARSAPGLFPRPIPKYHPQRAAVLEKFRFMGRLFAAAMRDEFMFPLPLSSAFLKLVQGAAESSILTLEDLPRPGFLGGEVFAAAEYVCKALESVDASDPPLSHSDLERRYKEIATDTQFARLALGKAFDCSFEDYFQDRTFVDPLDPSQGEDAAPLCHNGHAKHVTIHNVRQYVAFSLSFMLYDGVVDQAFAFRRGVEDFFPARYLRLFTPDEIQRDVCGVGDTVDSWDESAVRKLFKLDGGKGATEALVAVAAIGGEGGASLSRRFGPTSPTIAFLVKALVEASPKQRRQFLSFVTSVPIETPGRIEVVPMVSPSGDFLPMHDPSCLPRANTCARRLYLPKFETYETFAEVLWAVVREESKFKGFYEWRG